MLIGLFGRESESRDRFVMLKLLNGTSGTHHKGDMITRVILFVYIHSYYFSNLI